MDGIDYNAPSKVKNTAKKFKTHCQEHKELIIGLGVGLVVGATAVYLLKRDVKAIQINIKSPGSMINMYEGVTIRKGSVGYMVRCIETQQEFESQRQCAKLMGFSEGVLSSFFNGKIPDVGGYHFERIQIEDLVPQ